jgi:hypothetical protein
MIPLGYACIKASKQILKVPRNAADADDHAVLRRRRVRDQQHAFDIGVMVIAGVVAFVLEENGVPIAPAILGVVLGGMLEDNFVTSMIKSDGNLLAFFERPVAATLGALTLAVWFLPILMRRCAASPASDGERRATAGSASRDVALVCPVLPHCGIISKVLRPYPACDDRCGRCSARQGANRNARQTRRRQLEDERRARGQRDAPVRDQIADGRHSRPEDRGLRALSVPRAGERGSRGDADRWGAQDVSEHESGAFTGEVSARMLAEFGCRYAIVGHSERRQITATPMRRGGEGVAALAAGLTPIACVGETLAERDAGATMASCRDSSKPCSVRSARTR